MAFSLHNMKKRGIPWLFSIFRRNGKQVAISNKHTEKLGLKKLQNSKNPQIIVDLTYSCLKYIEWGNMEVLHIT